ncbi:MAG: PKD domain-containing protein [Chitinophagales bacterium]
MKNLHLLLVFTFLILKSAFPQVSGDNPVCAGDQANYSVPIVSGATYAWSVTGGFVSGSPYTDNVDIHWNGAGTGTIVVEVVPPSGPPIFHTLNVNINPSPSPVIASEPYPSCPPDTSRGQGIGFPDDELIVCEKVCKGATVEYSVSLSTGSTYAWSAIGESSISGASTNSVSVTWDNSDYGTLFLVETNSFGCTDSTKLCIEKVDLPVAAFNNQASVCKFSNVWLENNSTGATSYFWDFGDGNTSTAFEPNHNYSSGGIYTITLIAENECFCTDTIQNTITVDSVAGPEISCPSTICANDTMEYTANADTSCTFNWFAIGGNIVSGQGEPSVNIAWGPGQMGTIGLYLSGCTGVCVDTTFINVPIVPDEGTISGPSEVCPGDCAFYTLPHFSGATYSWSLNGGCGELQDTTSCNKVKICWSEFASACTDTLNVSYYDSFLNCGGSAQYIIDLRPKFQIFGMNTACSNASSGFSTSISCNWTVSPSGPILSGSPSNFVNIDWVGNTGTYVVTALPVDPTETCQDSARYVVDVIDPPADPQIVGDTIICPNSTTAYCAPGSSLNVNWIITGGSPATATNNCVTVNWDAIGPYLVQAYESSAEFPYCDSDTSTLNISAGSGTTPVINGPSVSCANATDVFSTPTTYPSGAIFTWTVNSNIDGTVLSQGSPSTSVEWGNNAPGNVWVALFVEVCGEVYADSVNVTLKKIPEPVVSQLAPLCENGSTDLSAGGGAFVSYNWSGPSGYTSTSNPTNISEDGLYQVTVTDADGCTGIGQINVSYVSPPNASISSPDLLRYCTGSTYTVNICALGNPDYTYVWSNAATTQCITTSSPGTFNVTVTDISNGCTAVSDPLSVVENNCTPDTCTPDGFIDFSYTDCNPVIFTNSSVNASNYVWLFGDGNSSTLTNPTHTYDDAGFYLVELSGDIPNIAGNKTCRVVDTMLVEIPLYANFDLESGCNGDAVCFTDKSATTAGSSIVNWDWDFGDGNFSTLQNPCHTYASPGTYYVELTISNAACIVTHRDTVEIDPSPSAAFTFPSPSCVATPVPFTDASTGAVNYWSWEFGNGATSLNQNPTVAYFAAGDYTVDLFVSDIYGCVDSISDTVEIVSPVNYGDISAYPDTIVCQGEDVVLVAPACASCDYLWSNGSTNDSITVNSTGIYTLEMDDGSGCTYSTFIRIIVNTAPAAVINNSGSNTICLGQAYSLNGNFNSNWSYQWFTDDGTNNGSTNSSIFFMPSSPGIFTYELVVTDNDLGCSDTSMPFIMEALDNPADPTITPVGASVVCYGETITLVGDHPDASVNLQWSTGAISDTISVTENGCYQLIATDTNGCSSSTTYCATINPLPELCSYYVGCFDTCAPYTIIGPVGGTSYQWMLNGSPISGANSKDYTANLSGLYALEVTNSFGCTDTTGELELNLEDCGPQDSLCAEFIIDTIFCNSDGNYEMQYYVINNSSDTVDRVNLGVLSPHLGLLFGPSVVGEEILPGDSSTSLSTTIYNGNEGDTICFRTHLEGLDSLGDYTLCCFSEPACVVLPPCDTSCCRFEFISDTIWCEQTSAGPKYYFDLLIDGCGSLNISSGNTGILNVNNPYTLINGLNTVSGSYIGSSQDEELCLTFTVDENQVVCKDTTICFPIHCKEHPLPCEWTFKPNVCEGEVALFNYAGVTTGLFINWSFPSGSPSSATGPGMHSITYNTPGTYPVIMTLTTSDGIATECIDSINVVERPNASISISGSTMLAAPAGMSYQWYEQSPWNLIFGANNQYFSTPKTGRYCVVVRDSYGCRDTACTEYIHVGIGELSNEGNWEIYPNPNQGSFNLELQAQTSGVVQFKITNILGEVIDHRQLSVSSGTQSFFINNSGLSTGIYFVELQTEQGSSVKRMLID